MDGKGFILLSQRTTTSKPWETQSGMAELKRRGARPKVAYVDDECCGAWPILLAEIWPGIQVKLDGMHALARLTQTTASTQHPWHAEFSAMLSSALYRDDPEIEERLKRAWQQDGQVGQIPKSIKRKLVPRHITDARRIAEAIEIALNRFKSKVHPDAGRLVTESTTAAWTNLKPHVLKGCLCDPTNMKVQVFEGRAQRIGGKDFHPLRTLRGTSALEGFHAHQQQWFGAFSQHGADASQALLEDGTLRWNNKRHNETNSNLKNPTFDHRLVNSVCELRDRLAAQSARTDTSALNPL